MATELRSLRVIPFDGKPRNWDAWSEKIGAKARRRGWKKLLIGQEKLLTQSEYEQAILDKDEAKRTLAELNEEAYEELVLSMDHTSQTGKVAFSLVKNSKTAEHPGGNCKIAWDRLVSKYAPKTAPSLLKLKKKFANSRLEDLKTNPDEWITELEGLRYDMEEMHIATTMSDLDFLIHVLNNLPEEYDVVLDGMESRLMLKDTDPKLLTIEDMRSRLNNRFERVKERFHEKERPHGDVAYYANTGFKGSCTKCGKYGHKGSDCRSRNGNGTGFKGTCYTCSEKGHMARNCPKRKERHSGSNEETANVAEETYDEMAF